jgi:hypothetical protein
VIMTSAQSGQIHPLSEVTRARAANMMGLDHPT